MFTKKILSLFSFKGRLNRLRYFHLFCIFFCLNTFLKFCIDSIPSHASKSAVVVFLFLSGIVTVYQFTLTARRFHDLNLNAGFALAFTGYVWMINLIAEGFGKSGILPLVMPAVIAQLVLMLRKGTIGSNQYGPDPLNRQMEYNETKE